MIQGNQTFQAGLSAQAKQPLYLLTIPQFGLYLASFTQAMIQPPNTSGYGTVLYGIGGYGT